MKMITDKKNINSIQKKLLYSFWIAIAWVIALIIVFEADLLISGFWTDNTTLEFIFNTLMQILLLVNIPLALRLFKFKSIKSKIQMHENQEYKAFVWWSNIRLYLIILPMIASVFLYYAFVAASFFYMTCILLIVLFFIYPSKERCLEETKPMSK